MTARAEGSLGRRLSAYTGERFPLPAYVPMILLAAFAAIGYSRVARGATGFASGGAYATAALTLLAAFFALRVADEHKDALVDRLTRPELPVPRGLVTLGELRAVAFVLALAAAIANAILHPPLLWVLGAATLWLGLMTREFFVSEWLRRKPALYLASHMVIMPLLLTYASAVDWMVAGARPGAAIATFIAASYATGLVLEVGRKIRAAPDERPGVETYTSSWGPLPAITVWLLALAGSAALITIASHLVDARWAATGAPLVAVAVAAAALPFVRDPRRAGSGKRIEAASAVWTLAAYALLALPWAERALG